MRRPRMLVPAVLLIAMVVVACGGTGTAQPSSGTEPGVTTGAGSTSGLDAGTGGPDGVGASGQPISGAVDPGDSCTFLTPDEATGALHSEPLVAQRGPAAGDCIYAPAADIGDGVGAVVIQSVRQENAQQAFEQWKGDDAVAVPGVGDAAASNGTKFTLRVDDLVVHIGVRWGTNDADAASATLIGRIIGARLTTGSVPPELQVTPPPTVTAHQACDLMTGTEASRILGIDGLEAQPNENVKQFCAYAVAATGEVVANVYFDPLGGRQVWDDMVGSLSAADVRGVGDLATWDDVGMTLYFLQGDAMMDIAVARFDVEGTTALEIAKALAGVMLTHL